MFWLALRSNLLLVFTIIIIIIEMNDFSSLSQKASFLLDQRERESKYL